MGEALQIPHKPARKYSELGKNVDGGNVQWWHCYIVLFHRIFWLVRVDIGVRTVSFKQNRNNILTVCLLLFLFNYNGSKSRWSWYLVHAFCGYVRHEAA